MPKEIDSGLWREDDVIEFLRVHRDDLNAIPKMDFSKAKISDLADGNVNQVFLVSDGMNQIIVKHAPPFLRVVPTWALSPDRNKIEAMYLEQAKEIVPEFVPRLYFQYGDTMVMEYIPGHQNGRVALKSRQYCPDLGRHIGEYVARMAFAHSAFCRSVSDLEKSAKTHVDPDLLKLTEELFFIDPYTLSARNKFSPELFPQMFAMSCNTALKIKVQKLKDKFLSHPEALIHGDLHTASLLVTETSTKVLDAEFSLYGPVGFDLGTFIANLIINTLAQFELCEDLAERKAYQAYLLTQMENTWGSFVEEFKKLTGSGAAVSEIVEGFLNQVWKDLVGYAGTEIIRRTVGLAHEGDLSPNPDPKKKVAIERVLVNLACQMILDGGKTLDCKAMLDLVQRTSPSMEKPKIARCDWDELSMARDLACLAWSHGV